MHKVKDRVSPLIREPVLIYIPDDDAYLISYVEYRGREVILAPAATRAICLPMYSIEEDNADQLLFLRQDAPRRDKGKWAA